MAARESVNSALSPLKSQQLELLMRGSTLPDKTLYWVGCLLGILQILLPGAEVEPMVEPVARHQLSV